MSDDTPALRVAFAGTPLFARVALDALLAAGYRVPLVLTQPDRPAGRGLQAQPSPVKQLALDRGLTVMQPRTLRDADARTAVFAAAECDVLVVAAYGLILPREMLDWPRFGCINIHASLLPRWRGAAPIHRAIEAGDDCTGITIMQMDAGLDTGPMLLAESLFIDADETTGHLHDRLAALGGRLIVTAMQRLEAGTLIPVAQPEEGVTYAHKIDKREAALDWSLPAEVLARKVRAFDPVPAATATLGGTVLKIWKAEALRRPADAMTPGTIVASGPDGVTVACGSGALRLLELQKPGGRRLPVGAFLQGFAMPAGVALEAHPGNIPLPQ